MIQALVMLVIVCQAADAQLRVGFYSETCPEAETIVRSVVTKAIMSDPRKAPELLRLQFHDCFVDGCEGSILIQAAQSEKEAFDHAGVRGLTQIDDAKTDLEQACPGIVSCSDIIALAARDAVVLVGGQSYEVETGRRDGKISNVSRVRDMPVVGDSITTLISKFRSRGLSEADLVVLSGAHTIGSAACFFVTKRLYNFTGSGTGSDPAISPVFLRDLESSCPKDGNSGIRVPIDATTPTVFDRVHMQNIQGGKAVLASDAQLYEDGFTKQLVDLYASGGIAKSFESDFGVAMTRMGRIGVQTGKEGEVRRVCNSFNSRAVRPTGGWSGLVLLLIMLSFGLM